MIGLILRRLGLNLAIYYRERSITTNKKLVTANERIRSLEHEIGEMMATVFKNNQETYKRLNKIRQRKDRIVSDKIG